MTLKISILILILLSIFVFLGTASIALAKATTSTTTTVTPVTLFPDNSCTGEQLILSGKAHGVIHSTVDDQGKIHLVTKTTTVLSGEGLDTGTKYQGTQTSHEVSNNSGSFPSTFTMTSHVPMISAGSSDNFIAHITFHITVNANGEVTSEVANSFFECRG